MFITKNAVRYFFAGICAFFLFFGATNSFAGSEPDHENIPGFKTAALGVTNFDIIVEPKNSSGEWPISAVEHNMLNSSSLMPENIYFFVMLPDGNFITLTQGNNYKTTVKFQTGTSVQFNVSNIKAWAFKKNDPNPPPAGYSITPIYSGGTTSFNATGAYDASKYLDPGKYIKVGASWSPWNKSNAYYYMIITYGNRTPSTIMNGDIKLDSCTFGSAGFQPTKYTTYNLGGTNLWISDQAYTSSTFSFSTLKPGEVRHIYVKMERSNLVNPIVPQFKASVTSNITNQVSECSNILLSDSPHDPNRKAVDQTSCTFGGIGTLIYTVVFQNEGKGVAEVVNVTDQFHGALNHNTVSLLSNSSNIPVISYHRSVTDILNKRITYRMGTKSSNKFPKPYNLPGLAQTSPRRYSYDETIGWVQFKIAATCPVTIAPITNSAKIVFIGINGPEPVISTNTINTQPDEILRPAQWPKPIKH